MQNAKALPGPACGLQVEALITAGPGAFRAGTFRASDLPARKPGRVVGHKNSKVIAMRHALSLLSGITIALLCVLLLHQASFRALPPGHSCADSSVA
jgi:hypothetical protein